MFQQIDLQIKDSAIYQSHADYSWGLRQLKLLFHLSCNFVKALSQSAIINVLNHYRRKKICL